MNLELLISKYLDSQLSDKEDHLLRSLIKEDEVAKQKFYSAVNIHMAFKEDAQSIEPPKDVVRDTEDKVMMKIMSQPTPVVHTMPTWKKASNLALAATFFLIFTIFNISDLQFGNDSGDIFAIDQETSAAQATVPMQALYSLLANTNAPEYQEAQEVSVQRNSSIAQIRENNVEETIETTNTNLESNSSSFALDDEASNEVNNTTIEEEPTEPATIITNESTEDEELAGIFEIEVPVESAPAVVPAPVIASFNNNVVGSTVASAPSANIRTTSNYSSFPSTYNNYERFGTKDLKVSLTSFFGTDIVRGAMDGIKETSVSHFSQSIGYSQDEVNRFGLEFGFSDYIFQNQNYGRVPLGSEIPLPNGGGGPNKIDPIRNENDQTFTVNYDDQKKVYFGSFFYERSILKNEDFSLDGRLSLGMSGDGPIGMTRFFGTYNIFSGFSVTLGLEGRLFNMKLPRGTQIEEHYRGSVSMIYGVQFIL
jgi:hypothetical protein